MWNQPCGNKVIWTLKNPSEQGEDCSIATGRVGSSQELESTLYQFLQTHGQKTQNYFQNWFSQVDHQIRSHYGKETKFLLLQSKSQMISKTSNVTHLTLTNTSIAAGYFRGFFTWHGPLVTYKVLLFMLSPNIRRSTGSKVLTATGKYIHTEESFISHWLAASSSLCLQEVHVGWFLASVEPYVEQCRYSSYLDKNSAIFQEE